MKSLGSRAQPQRPKSRRPIESWLSSIIPTSNRPTRKKRQRARSSAKSQQPTRSSLMRKKGSSTICARSMVGHQGRATRPLVMTLMALASTSQRQELPPLRHTLRQHHDEPLQQVVQQSPREVPKQHTPLQVSLNTKVCRATFNSVTTLPKFLHATLTTYFERSLAKTSIRCTQGPLCVNHPAAQHPIL